MGPGPTGRSPARLRRAVLAGRRGGTAPRRERPEARRPGGSGGLGDQDQLGDRTVLVLGGASLITAVPLELGGLLLVGAVYCDSDESVSAHLDMTPTVGLLPQNSVV